MLKPLSSAISIGTGGPFGAEGPIIMTGGAFGSLFAQFFHLIRAERKTLLVAGAAAGMAAIFGTPVAAVLLAVELLLFEWKPRSFIPVAVARGRRDCLASVAARRGPAFPVCRHRRDSVVRPWALRAAARHRRRSASGAADRWLYARRGSVPANCRFIGCGGRRFGGIVVGIGG